VSEHETLSRFTDRLTDSRSEAWAPEDLVSFGWSRGMRETSPMFELRKKTGLILAVGYSWLEQAEFDPSEGIFLDVGDQRIAIRGRNLNAEVRPGVRLFEGITRHRVPWIRELSNAEVLTAGEAACIIESIEW